MKVYLLKTDNYEGDEIHGIYSSREKAIESLSYHESNLSEDDIEEVEVDPPNGERYEMFYRAESCTDGTVKTGPYKHRMLPSSPEATDIRLMWCEENTKGYAVAYATTEQEAREKATAALSLLKPVWQVGRNRSNGSIIKHRHPHPDNVYNQWPKPYAVHTSRHIAESILLRYEATGQALPGLVTHQQAHAAH